MPIFICSTETGRAEGGSCHTACLGFASDPNFFWGGGILVIGLFGCCPHIPALFGVETGNPSYPRASPPTALLGLWGQSPSCAHAARARAHCVFARARARLADPHAPKDSQTKAASPASPKNPRQMTKKHGACDVFILVAGLWRKPCWLDKHPRYVRFPPTPTPRGPFLIILAGARGDAGDAGSWGGFAQRLQLKGGKKGIRNRSQGRGCRARFEVQMSWLEQQTHQRYILRVGYGRVVLSLRAQRHTAQLDFVSLSTLNARTDVFVLAAFVHDVLGNFGLFLLQVKFHVKGGTVTSNGNTGET